MGTTLSTRHDPSCCSIDVVQNVDARPANLMLCDGEMAEFLTTDTENIDLKGEKCHWFKLEYEEENGTRLPLRSTSTDPCAMCCQRREYILVMHTGYS